MTTQTIDEISGNIFDIRDVIARFEELESEREEAEDTAAWDKEEEGEEYAKLKELLEATAGMGGDEQWRGDWYPVTFIRSSYFTEYAEEMLKDIGELPKDIPWYIVIDWEATAHNIRQDYTSVDFNGDEYWYR